MYVNVCAGVVLVVGEVGGEWWVRMVVVIMNEVMNAVGKMQMKSEESGESDRNEEKGD